MWADRSRVSFGKSAFALINDISAYNSATARLLFNGILICRVGDLVFLISPKL